MVQCAVEGCSSRSDTVSIASRIEHSIHFHRAPKDPCVRKKWMQAINKTGFTKSTRVCSLHFKKENYYSTKLGLQKLHKGSVPELKLTKEITKDVTTDSSGEGTMSNVQPPKKKKCYPSKSEQSGSKKQSPKRKTADVVLESSSVKIKDETTDSSEDEEMTDVQPQGQNIDLTNKLEQSTTNDVTESRIIKPGVQKHKLKTSLEKKLYEQVKKLQESGKEKMEAIHCLLEQNKRLLERNSVLEKVVDEMSKQSCRKLN